MTDRTEQIDAIRRTIDALDVELLDLLNRRGRAALDVAALKRHEAEPRYYRPEREAALFRRLVATSEGPLPPAEVRRLFCEIVSTCRALEHRLVVGCTTVDGARAAIGHFGGAVDLRPVTETAEVLDAVAAARCDYAVIAFSHAGAASPAVADLPERGLALCGEWYAHDAERYVVVGSEPCPPSGEDWRSFVVPTEHVDTVGAWCDSSNLPMRATPVAGRASSIVEVAVRADEPRLAGVVREAAGVVLGAFPDAGAGKCAQ